MCSQGLQYVPRQRNSIVPTVRQGKAFTDVYGNKCCYLWKNKTAATRHKKYTCVHSRILLPCRRTDKQTPRKTQQVDPVNQGGGRSIGDKDCVLGFINTIPKWGHQGLRHAPFGRPKVPPAGPRKGSGETSATLSICWF